MTMIPYTALRNLRSGVIASGQDLRALLTTSPIDYGLIDQAMATPHLAVSPLECHGGDEVTVSWSSLVGAAPGAWIGLYHPGDASESPIDWFYTSSATKVEGASTPTWGSGLFTMPSRGGLGAAVLFECRLFSGSDFNPLAISARIDVD